MRLWKSQGNCGEPYNLGFGQAIKQMRYLFASQELNFTLLNPFKDMDEIMAKTNQNNTPD